MALGPHAYSLAIEAFNGTCVALEQAAGFLQADVIFHREIHVSFGMGQDWQIAHVQKPLHFIYRNDVPYLGSVADGKFDEDVIALPGQKPAFFKRFRPCLRDKPILHGRNQFQGNVTNCQCLPQTVAGAVHDIRRIAVQIGPVRRADGPLKAPGHLTTRQIGRHLQTPGSVINLRKNMTMAVYFHCSAKIRIIFGLIANLSAFADRRAA